MAQLGVAIFVVILLNGLFAFIQEYRADRAGERLWDLLPRRATVLRDRVPTEVDTVGLVIGDAVLLKAGDRISADLELVESYGLRIDTSMLTGESVPTVPTDIRLFAGCFVVEGEGVAVVTAIGTRLAGIVRTTEARCRPPTPLSRELGRVVRVIAVVSLTVGIVFLVIALLVGIRWTSAFLFAVGVTVALVPEGLLPTVTLALAMGAQRLATRHALVRRLESVETLGSTTFICTDKTGTLTRNQMSVVEVWTPLGSARVEGAGYEPSGKVDADPVILVRLREVARMAGRCSKGGVVRRDGCWIAQGDPMEAAIDLLARRLRVDLAADELLEPTEQRFPFNTRRRLSRCSIIPDCGV